MSLFKLIHPEAVEPQRATRLSAGYDITAVSREWNEAKTALVYRTGLTLNDVPEGYFAALFPRSSIYKYDIRLANSVGIVDTDYTGEILIHMDVPLSAAMVVSPGNCRLPPMDQPIAQILFLPVLVEDVIAPTEERGDGAFGSTTDKPKRAKK